MVRTPSGASKGPTPDTTPAARANRMGSPSLSRMLAVVAVAIVAAVAIAMSLDSGDDGPEAGGLTTAAPPSGAGPNPDGEIDSAGRGDAVSSADTAPPEGAVAPGSMGGISQGPSDPDAPNQTPE